MNPENLKPFAKDDPRINRKGRPKSFKALRTLVISIASEPVKDGDERTRIEERIRKALKSDNPADLALLLKYGWGNVPDALDVTSGGEKITVRLVRDD